MLDLIRTSHLPSDGFFPVPLLISSRHTTQSSSKGEGRMPLYGPYTGQSWVLHLPI